MAPQGAPEVLKWSPRMSKWKHRDSQMATPRSQKRPLAEGVALKIHIYTDKTTRCVIRSLRGRGLWLGGKRNYSINQFANQSVEFIC